MCGCFVLTICMAAFLTGMCLTPMVCDMCPATHPSERHEHTHFHGTAGQHCAAAMNVAPVPVPVPHPTGSCTLLDDPAPRLSLKPSSVVNGMGRALVYLESIWDAVRTPAKVKQA
jgi:hypothetical protein